MGCPWRLNTIAISDCISAYVTFCLCSKAEKKTTFGAFELDMGLYISRQFVPETKLLPPMELKVGQRLYVQVGIVKYIVLHSSEWVVIEYVFDEVDEVYLVFHTKQECEILIPPKYLLEEVILLIRMFLMSKEFHPLY